MKPGFIKGEIKTTLVYKHLRIYVFVFLKICQLPIFLYQIIWVVEILPTTMTYYTIFILNEMFLVLSILSIEI